MYTELNAGDAGDTFVDPESGGLVRGPGKGHLGLTRHELRYQRPAGVLEGPDQDGRC